AQKQKAHRIERDLTGRFQLFHSFLEEQQPLRNASGTDVAEPQPRGAGWDEYLEVTPCGTERTFQQGDGVEQVVFVETRHTRGQAREGDAGPVRLLDTLDLLQTRLPVGDRVRELAEWRETVRQPVTHAVQNDPVREVARRKSFSR